MWDDVGHFLNSSHNFWILRGKKINKININYLGNSSCISYIKDRFYIATFPTLKKGSSCSISVQMFLWLTNTREKMGQKLSFNQEILVADDWMIFFFPSFWQTITVLAKVHWLSRGWAHNILNLWVTFDCKAVAQLTLLEALVGNLWRWQQICRKQTYYSAAGGKCSTKRDSMSALLASHFSGYQLRTKLPLRFFNLLFKLHLYWYQITLLGLYL